MARGAAPDKDVLAGLTGGGGRLHKAPAGDPVLAAAGQSAPPPTPGPGSQAGTRELRGSPPVTEAQEQEKKTKVGFYALPSDMARAKAAYANTPADLRAASWSDFVAEAVMEKVGALEILHNKGKPWPAGRVARGRPARQ